MLIGFNLIGHHYETIVIINDEAEKVLHNNQHVK